MFSCREDIQFELSRINERLAQRNMFLSLDFVGGASLLMNDLTGCETTDADAIAQILEEIEKVLDELSADVIEDAMYYKENCDGRGFVVEDDMQFSNITITFRAFPAAILAKMQNVANLSKMETLVKSLEQDFDIVETNFDSIILFLESMGYAPTSEDEQIVKDFFETYEELDNNYQ